MNKILHNVTHCPKCGYREIQYNEGIQKEPIFQCTVEECKYTAEIIPPTCETCKDEMTWEMFYSEGESVFTHAEYGWYCQCFAEEEYDLLGGDYDD